MRKRRLWIVVVLIVSFVGCGIVSRRRLEAEYYYVRIVLARMSGNSGVYVGYSMGLAAFGAPEAIPPMLRLLRSSDSFVRANAARDLADYKDERVVNALMR